MFKILSMSVLVLLLAACGAPRPRQAPPPHPGKSAATLNLPTGRVYRVDETQSELRVLVYRAGPLARFGHNHVVVNRAIRGAVTWVEEAAVASAFWLDVPVAGFVVDDTQARRDEGLDFNSEVPPDAKAGTLHNMLGAAVLNVDEFPLITVHSLPASGARGASSASGLVATVAIRVAGHESTIDVPFALHADPHRLSATGMVELRQTALGLTPYSLMLGALQVQDSITIKFAIVAVSG